jgi:glycosyltransferase involved in cell wall biosynthesis
LARARLGLGDAFVVAYVGSLEWYQLADQSLRLFRIIATERPGALFVAITTNPKRMEAAIRAADVDANRVRILCLPSPEVPDVLAAADVGLMPRAQNQVNAVASPVKMGEYMAAGVPVVTTPWVGDYSRDIESHDLGVCVDLERSDGEIARRIVRLIHATGTDAEQRRERCRHFAATELAWPALVRTRLEVVYLKP